MANRLFPAPLYKGVHIPKTDEVDPHWKNFFNILSSQFNTSGNSFTPTVTASPYTYTNNTSAPQQVFVSGGTVSLMQLVRTLPAGTTTLTVTGAISIYLSGGDALTITYSVAPTVTVLPV